MFFSYFLSILPFFRMGVANPVREDYSEGKLLIFTAFSLLVGAICNRPNHCFFHFLGFGRLEIAPIVREDYRGGNSLMLVCVGRAIRNRPYFSRRLTWR